MDQDLSLLTTEQITLLKDAHAYITVLIAGADGNIDEAELSWAEKIAEIRTYAGDERLNEFHEEVNKEIADKIKQLVAALPSDPASRNQVISETLSGLNPILAALNPSIGAYLYKGYVSFAERIAKASGGVLSFFTIGPEERKWVGLPMITPITFNPDEEE
jgi:hypothetical protein